MEHYIFPGKFENLEKICDLVTNSAIQAGFDDSAVYAIQTAVDEACSNVIEHAYGGEDRGTIEIKVKTDKKCITITIGDHGQPFNPDDIPDPNTTGSLEQREAHGLGLYFMRKLMDKVSFDFSNETGNTVTMVKCLHPQR